MMDLVEFMFMESYTDIEAVEAVKLYIEAGKVIPVELYPYIAMACGAWQKSPGKAREIGKINTAMAWNHRVWNMQLLRQLQHLSIPEAAKIVAKADGIAWKKLDSNYRTTKYTSAKEDADFIYNNSNWNYS